MADLMFEAVDRAVVLHDGHRRVTVALDHRVDCRGELGQCNLAHALDLASQAFQLVVVALDDVFGSAVFSVHHLPQ